MAAIIDGSTKAYDAYPWERALLRFNFLVELYVSQACQVNCIQCMRTISEWHALLLLLEWLFMLSRRGKSVTKSWQICRGNVPLVRVCYVSHRLTSTFLIFSTSSPDKQLLTLYARYCISCAVIPDGSEEHSNPTCISTGTCSPPQKKNSPLFLPANLTEDQQDSYCSDV